MSGFVESMISAVKDIKDDLLALSPPPKDPNPAMGDEGLAVGYIKRTHAEAQRRRREQELQAAINVAFYEGNQWLMLNTASQQLELIRDQDDPLYYYTQNHFHRVVTIAAGLATQNQPDASPSPLTSSELDFLAAKEARAVLGYADRRFARDLESEQAALWAFLCGCSWTLRYWDEKETAEVDVGGVVKNLPVGNICGEVVPWFEVYVDPEAIRYEDALWVDRKSIRTMEWLRQRFGDRAEGVTPDATFAEGGQFGSYASTYIQGYADRRKRIMTGVTVIERWERPSSEYPEGRYFVTAGGRMMQPIKPNPYANRPGTNPFPLVRHAYKEAFGHPYGFTLGAQLVEPQRAYNVIYSKLIHREETAKAFLLIDEGAEVSPKAIDTKREMEKVVYHAQGSHPPQYSAPPPLSGDAWETLSIIQAQMEDAAGARDIAQGKAPAGMPAAGIELLQRANSTQHGAHIRRLERRAEEVGELELYLFGKFGSGPLPRLLGMDADGNPAEGISQAAPLRYLSSGGSCRVLVTPGSASPQEPAAQDMRIMELRAAGVLGPFETLSQAASALATVRLLSFSRSDKILEEIEKQIHLLVAQMEQEQAQAQAQQEQMIAMQQAQMESQAAQQPTPEDQLAMMQAQQEMEARAKEHDASLTVQTEAAKAALQSMTAQPAPPQRSKNGR